jgi:hypothetical protein
MTTGLPGFFVYFLFMNEIVIVFHLAYTYSISNGAAIARAGMNFGGPRWFFCLQRGCYQTCESFQGWIGNSLGCHSWQRWQLLAQASKQQPSSRRCPHSSFFHPTCINMASSNNAIDPTLDLMMTPTTTRTSPRKKANGKASPATEQTTTKKKSKDKNNTDGVEVVKESKKKNPNWSIEENKQLCTEWLNTSRDAIVGIGQKGATFWDRVHQLYTELVEKYNKEKQCVKKFKPLPVQLVNAVECCWGHIMKTCNKFGGCYSQVEGRLASGRTRDDIVSTIPQLITSVVQNDSFIFLFSFPRPKNFTRCRTRVHSILTIAGQS